MTESTRFIGDLITVEYDIPPVLEKKPGCPNRFIWQGERYVITTKLQEWHDYRRRGRMAMNMRPEHAEHAAAHGSWGVGRDYYRVETDRGRVFDLYYDRAPKGMALRKGQWFLYRELEQNSAED